MMHAALRVFAVIGCLVSPVAARDALPPVDAAAIVREIRPRANVPALVCAVVTKDGVHAIGADGATSWVRGQLGIRMNGMPPLAQQINVYFHADLSELTDRLGDAQDCL